MPPSMQSEIWTYFKPVENDRDKSPSKICSKTYSLKGQTTSSLKNHLKSMQGALILKEFALFEANNEKQIQKRKPDAGDAKANEPASTEAKTRRCN
ncbi:unnamed protein product [Leptosia nina]|uniref:BED-type domain-containing protein n=1 Tax=Leptosia nina TaxID=320188 RepID=A0AAV1JXS6_9NEOP